MLTTGERTALYRLYDVDRKLIYVGITGNPEVRFAQHASDKPWWPRVVHREIEWYGSRAAAAAAEEAAIKLKSPTANKQHSPDYPNIPVTVLLSSNQLRSLNLLCKALDVQKMGRYSAHDMLLACLLMREFAARGLEGDPPRYDVGMSWPDGIGVTAE